MLGESKGAGEKTRVKDRNQISTENIPEPKVEFHREPVEARGLVSGHALECTKALIRSEEILTKMSLVTGEKIRKVRQKRGLDDRIRENKSE